MITIGTVAAFCGQVIFSAYAALFILFLAGLIVALFEEVRS